ncbi:uncharacterized protein OCT59_020041 [Rhizophagus irregularis]|uniref:uncharacterized protein n=1 Tax=Rhizophagus irregularis TaxID=588596 RepID=UPI00332FECE1|nr:hypothetical protein OCT59_020041 [Rhizophagus irregularis]
MTPQIFCRHHIQEQIQIDTETRIKKSKRIDVRNLLSNRGDKNDAVVYQDEDAMIIYEQSFGANGIRHNALFLNLDEMNCRIYRLYEIFSCKIPTTFTDRWLLVKIVNIGVYLKALLMER